MMISFSSTVQDIVNQELVIFVKPVAGIEAIRMPHPSSIAHRDGGTATWQDVRRGTRVQVRGVDNGTAQLQAEQLLILGEDDVMGTLPATVSDTPHTP